LGKYFSSSAEVFSWLSRFINFETGQMLRTFRLERMEALAELAGHPERCAPAIHIAGSKGKGSVTGMIASVLEADGRKAARYMSPHITDYRERISLGNSFFDEEIYCAAGDELRDLAESAVATAKNGLFDPARADDIPSFFEMLTLLFFICARNSRCDVIVAETGMGGRLDATNILDPLVSVITLIELEHTSFLGNTIEAVAGEKAGIIKPGRPLILAKQCPEALEVFKKRTAEKNSPLLYFPEIASVENIRVHQGGTDFTLNFLNATRNKNFTTEFHGESGEKQLELCVPLWFNIPLSIPIPGAVQAENAGLAVAALKTAFPDISEDVIRGGLERVKIHARFEKISDNPPLILDGAHTPESASLCVETFTSLYGEGGILLFGCAADKNAAAMAEILLPRFSRVFITTPGASRISEPEKVYRAFAESFSSRGSDKTIFVKDTREAIKQAMEAGREKGLPVLCTGSFYLASEVCNIEI
jgi:dihydrofolate synthase/folylpolyglutamate synthase